MKKIVRGLLLIICVVSVCFSLNCITQAAVVGGIRKDVKLPDYKKVVKIRIDPNNFTKSMKSALAEAAQKASNSKQYKIIVPKGRHTCEWSFYVPSNTWIYAKGAVLDYNSAPKERAYMVSNWERSTGSDVTRVTKNIRITGGTWDNSGWPDDSTWNEVAPFHLSNIRNLVIENIKLKTNRNMHILEFADITGLRVSGCTIYGNPVRKRLQPKEALQLDVAETAAFAHCLPNGKGCHNVTIVNNKFYSVERGIGSHNYVFATTQNPSYTNVFICNNTFSRMHAEPIFMLHAKGATISGNKMNTGKRCGVYLEDCSYMQISGNNIKKITPFDGDRASTYGNFKTGIALADCQSVNIGGNKMPAAPGKQAYYTYGPVSSNITVTNNTLR
ncbi:MAG: right-handed parallel beta-helix repeat-containing protein [Blautia sp.]|nr:right-handed parallel beta-helix repeat-containing protein [Blautia sp.]